MWLRRRTKEERARYAKRSNRIAAGCFLVFSTLALLGILVPDLEDEKPVPVWPRSFDEPGVVTVYTFDDPKPRLEFRRGRITAECANAILQPLDLPGVEGEGASLAVDRGRDPSSELDPFDRFAYRWDRYPLGQLTFHRDPERNWEGEKPYVALRRIAIGPLPFGEQLERETE